MGELSATRNDFVDSGCGILIAGTLTPPPFLLLEFQHSIQADQWLYRLLTVTPWQNTTQHPSPVKDPHDHERTVKPM
jgi:hypothetical protein